MVPYRGTTTAIPEGNPVGLFDELKDKISHLDPNKNEAEAQPPAPEAQPADEQANVDAIEKSQQDALAQAEAEQAAAAAEKSQQDALAQAEAEQAAAAAEKSQQEALARAEAEQAAAEKAAQQAQAQKDAAAKEAAAKAEQAKQAAAKEAAAKQAAAKQAAAPKPQRKYTVKPGDTLSGIAAHYGVNYMDIARANNIANPDLIYPGQTFVIPD